MNHVNDSVLRTVNGTDELGNKMNTKQIIEMIDLFYALKRMYKRLKKQEHGQRIAT